VLREDRLEVYRAVTALPTRIRQVLVLRYYLDLPHAEIARTLGISESTARSATSRGIVYRCNVRSGSCRVRYRPDPQVLHPPRHALMATAAQARGAGHGPGQRSVGVDGGNQQVAEGVL
jgi:hypothetical protein